MKNESYQLYESNYDMFLKASMSSNRNKFNIFHRKIHQIYIHQISMHNMINNKLILANYILSIFLQNTYWYITQNSQIQKRFLQFEVDS